MNLIDFIQKHRTAFLVESVLLIILGLLAIALPFYATLSIELMIGWILIFGGIVQLYKSFKTIRESGGILSLIISILYVAAGVLLLIYPLKGMLTLTMLIGIFFLIDGISKIALSFNLKPLPNWGWILFNGILSILMSAIILYGWPATSLWVIGLLVGINLVFFGLSLISLVTTIPKNTP